MNYTPTTDVVRRDYCFSNQRPDICGKNFGEEFDRWLAEEVRKAKEDAYDEGHEDGWDTGVNVYRFGEMSKGKVNPYRKETND